MFSFPDCPQGTNDFHDENMAILSLDQWDFVNPIEHEEKPGEKDSEVERVREEKEEEGGREGERGGENIRSRRKAMGNDRLSGPRR